MSHLGYPSLSVTVFLEPVMDYGITRPVLTKGVLFAGSSSPAVAED